MKKINLILCLIITVLLASTANAKFETCQKLGGVDCSGCCADPIDAVNTNNCCKPDSCFERIQKPATFQDLGQTIVERFPDNSYGIFYGPKKALFGITNFVKARKIDTNRLDFNIRGRAFQFSVNEKKCSFTISNIVGSQNCVDDLSCDKYFILFAIDHQEASWNSEAQFRKFANAHFEFFKDISNFKFKKAGLVIMPFEFSKKECNVERLVRIPDIIKKETRLKDCADRYAQKLGIDYEKAAGFINTQKGQGFARFGSKVALSSRGGYQGGPNSITTTAHEWGHTFFLCDEYSEELFRGQNNYIASNIVGGCKNKFPDPCIGRSRRDCLGSSPVFRKFSGPSSGIVPGMMGVCIGPRKTSIMGIYVPSNCGYDVTGGYNAIK